MNSYKDARKLSDGIYYYDNHFKVNNNTLQ